MPLATRPALVFALASLVACQSRSGPPEADAPAPDSEARPDPLEDPQNRGWVRLRPRDTPRDGSLARAEIERLQALGYVNGSEAPRDGLVGVTVHDPERTTPGLNLVVSGHAHEASLMDASGRTLHTWRKNVEAALPGRETHATHFRRAHLFPNGDLLVLYARADGMVKLDRCSNVLWAAPNGAHHDFEVQPNGDIYALVREAHVVPRLDPREPVLEDFVVVLGPSGEEKRRVSLLAAFMDSEFERLWGRGKPRTGDVFHTNSVNVFREMPDVQIRSFRPGEVLVSILKLNIIAVLDMDQERIVWAYKGSFKLQHDAQLLPNGHLLLFDNRGLGTRSRILELDVAGGEPAWEYPGADHESFYSETRGLVQRFDNGNTLITETDSGRAFEVSPEGETVWEFFNPHRAGDEGQYIAALLVMRRLSPDFPVDWIGPCPGS